MGDVFASVQNQTERQQTEKWLRRRLKQFGTRQEFEVFCEHSQLTDEQRVALESYLPAHLTVRVETRGEP